MSLKMFRFSIENTRIYERTAFIGDGETILDAMKNELKGVQDTFRPKNDGKMRDPIGLAITLKNSQVVNRKLEDFESDMSWAAPNENNELDFPE